MRSSANAPGDIANRGKPPLNEIIVMMKRVRAALIFASLAGFGFGVANGCGTDPVSPRLKRTGTGGSASATGGSGGAEVGSAGTSVGASGGPGAGGTSTTGEGGANGVTTGAGGANGGSGGDMAGAGGTNAGSGGDMAGAGGTNGGSSGAGGANGGSSGASGASGAAGAGGSTPVGCTNATVVDAAGSKTKCPAMNTWTVTAMPTPPSMYLGIADNKLQPQYAIDGNTGTRYSSGATAAGGEWFRVDLGAATQITGVVLDNSIDVNDVPYGYKVEVSTDGNAWTQVATCNAIASTTETINFAAKAGRYVRVTQTAVGIHWWSIDELGVLCK